MAHDWMLDVIADLRTYAIRNGLPALAAELDEAKLVAATEIASVEQKAPVAVNSDARTSRYAY